MEKVKVIIDKILDDAKSSATQFEEQTRQRLALELKQAEKQIAENKIKALEEYQKELELLDSQSVAMAELESKKQLLNQKQGIINSVFESAKQEVLNKKNKDYLDLIKKLIEKNCKNNDEVIICKKDEKTITERFVESISTATKKSLKRVVGGDFEGGIILSNKNYDKILTVDKLFELLRNDIEKDVIEILFKNV